MHHCVWLVSVLVLTHMILPATSQTLRVDSLQPQKVNRCLMQTKCGKCIGAGSECAFCTDKEYDVTNNPRCDLLTTHKQRGCSGIVAPSSVFNSSSELTNVKNQSVGDATGGKDAIQVQPQVLDLKIKTNDPQFFTLTYRLARNYPVDLYYLMDMSKTMEDDKAELTRLGVQMINELKNFTSDFRIGFGSFVDKVTMPFVSTAKNKINSPCPGCAPAYEFQNQLSLTPDVQMFTNTLSSVKISGNLDAPEGGSDGILQAISCDMSIGWRRNARRIIVYASDAGIHFAGDGKLGGIVNPNDGSCHMNNAGRYTEGANQDYPSVSQVADSVKDKNINVIFAVTKEQVPVYQKLSSVFPGSEIDTLDKNSQNIVQLVRNNFKKITSKVEMIAENAGNAIVKFKSKCKGYCMTMAIAVSALISYLELSVLALQMIWNGRTDNSRLEEIETNSCTDIQFGDSVQFTVSIEIPECPADSTTVPRSLTIKPIGVREGVKINIDLICQCDCEKIVSTLPHSYCNNKGYLECGVCHCTDPYFGKTCSCNGTAAELEARCIKPGSYMKCSGRGNCECGSCVCDARQSNSVQRYSGTYCECDNYNCPFYNATLCGGTDHGTCKCGKCECSPLWSGESCGCSTDETTCKANRGTGAVCNGKGQCICGECKCSPGFYGPTCQDCATCQEICLQQKPCVQCSVFQNGDYSQTECETKCTNTITTVNPLPGGGKICEFKDSDDCRFSFTYSYNEKNELQIHALGTKECPKPVDVGAIVGGVIGGLVAVAIICLLLWKFYVYTKDKRELQAFLKEQEGAVWAKEDNPIYKKATRTYANPTFGRGK